MSIRKAGKQRFTGQINNGRWGARSRRFDTPSLAD
jgi:hypothetical protein